MVRKFQERWCEALNNVFIHETAQVGERSQMGHNVVIHANVILGIGVEIGDNVVICEGTHIGDYTRIGPNSVLGKQPMSNRRMKRKPDLASPLQLCNEIVIGAGAVLFAGSSFADGVLIGDLASVREGVRVGQDSVIGRSVIVELSTLIGQRVVLQSGSYITGDSIVEDDVFVGPEVSTSNDKYMGLKPFEYKGPHIESFARIGNNATLLPGVRIGTRSVVGAGAVVTKDVAPEDIVVGVPAKSIVLIHF